MGTMRERQLDVDSRFPRRDDGPPPSLSRTELADWIDYLCAVDGAEQVSAYRDTAERLADALRASPERIPNGACIQVGIGSIPGAFLSQLSDHRYLGVHAELFSDGIADLFEMGVINGTKKFSRPGRMVATFALGSRRLYDFIVGNEADAGARADSSVAESARRYAAHPLGVSRKERT